MNFSSLSIMFASICALVSLMFYFQHTEGHSFLHCHHAEQCQNQVFNYTNWTDSDGVVTMHCHGMATCYNSTIRSTIGNWFPQCDGAAACMDLRQITTNRSSQTMQQYLCGGYYGCYNAFTSTQYTSSANCNGMKSCYGSDTTIWAVYIQCKGVASCMNTQFRLGYDSSGLTSASIFGYGAFSLANANITTIGLGKTINIRFYGYLSGYKTIINCLGNDSCTIYCYSALACVDITFNCDDDASCEISDDSDEGTSNYGNYIDGLTDGDDDDIEDFIDDLMFLIDELDIVDDDMYDIGDDYSTYYDKLCAYNTCKGKYMCENVTMEITSDGDTDGHFCVTGYSAAINSVIMANNSDIVVDSSDSLVYDEYSANSGTDAEYTGNNIYCRGSDTCIGNLTTNDGTGSIYCQGDGSCAGDDDYNIIWKNIEAVYCSGSDTCDSLTMYGITNIYGLGEDSLKDATINSDSSGQTLNIYLSGEGAGDGMTVNCNSNDDCTIYCLDTNFNCLNDIDYTLNCGSSADCSVEYYFNYNGTTTGELETTQSTMESTTEPTIETSEIVGEPDTDNAIAMEKKLYMSCLSVYIVVIIGISSLIN